ncbi:hypothetical protein ACUXIS_003207 [Cytobacillus horneckiae]
MNALKNALHWTICSQASLGKGNGEGSTTRE